MITISTSTFLFYLLLEILAGIFLYVCLYIDGFFERKKKEEINQ